MHILVIWTVVAVQVGSMSSGSHLVRDWRAVGEFANEASCVEAARELGYPADSKNFRCLKVNNGK